MSLYEGVLLLALYKAWKVHSILVCFCVCRERRVLCPIPLFSTIPLIKLHPNQTTIKMTYWRNVGLTYLRYSRIAAQQVRKSLKADAKRDPLRDTSTIKISYKAEQK